MTSAHFFHILLALRSPFVHMCACTYARAFLFISIIVRRVIVVSFVPSYILLFEIRPVASYA